MADDWIKVRGATKTEKKIFELKAQLKWILILIVGLIVCVFILNILSDNPGLLSGEEVIQCKTSADCPEGQCCGGYIKQTGNYAGYATCRDETTSKCFD